MHAFRKYCVIFGSLLVCMIIIFDHVQYFYFICYSWFIFGHLFAYTQALIKLRVRSNSLLSRSSV